jgi:hypothetical protein
MNERIFKVYVKGKEVGELRYVDYDLGLDHRYFYYKDYRTKEKDMELLEVELLACDLEGALQGLLFDYKKIFNCEYDDVTFKELINGRFVEVNIDEI